MARRKGRISTKEYGEVATEPIPAGTVLAYVGTTAPGGWLLCDGSAVSRITYARLFAAISTAHGTGDGSTTFRIPDYRGRFLRGVDNTQGRDPDRASRTAMNTGGNTGDNVGSIQGHAFQTHDHPDSTSGNQSANHTHAYSGYRASSNSVNVGYNFDALNGTNGSAVTPNSSTQSANHTHTITVNSKAAAGSNVQTSTAESRPVNAGVNFIIKV